MSRSCRLVEAPVRAGGRRNLQPVALDGVASTYRFLRRHWRIRHLVFGHGTGTDRSRQGILCPRRKNRANSAGRLENRQRGG